MLRWRVAGPSEYWLIASSPASVHTLNLQLLALFKEVIRDVWKSCSIQLLHTNTMKSDRKKATCTQAHLSDQLGLTVLTWFSRCEPHGSCWICNPHKGTECACCCSGTPQSIFHPFQWTINSSTYTYFMQNATPLLFKNQNPILWPSFTEVHGVIKQFDWPQHNTTAGSIN